MIDRFFAGLCLAAMALVAIGMGLSFDAAWLHIVALAATCAGAVLMLNYFTESDSAWFILLVAPITLVANVLAYSLAGLARALDASVMGADNLVHTVAAPILFAITIVLIDVLAVASIGYRIHKMRSPARQ